MRPFRFHFILILLTTLAVFAARFIGHKHYLEQRRSIQVASAKQRVTDLVGEWSKFRYTNAVGDILAKVLVGEINWKGLKLTEIQEDTLKDGLCEVISYLSDPNFDTYYRLGKKDLSRELNLSPIAKHILSLSGVTNAPNDEVQLLHTLWNQVHIRSTSNTPSSIKGLSLEQVRIAVTNINAAYVILNGSTANRFTSVAEALEPGFCYGGQTNPVSSDTTEGLFFHLSFFARSSTSIVPGPVYLSLYWSEMDKKWAMSRLFTDKVLNFHTMF